MPIYVVQPGDCLSSIASMHGFATWKTIYDAPENAKYRELRPDPNTIYPGDELFLPEKGKKTDDAPVDQKHKYKKHGSTTFLRIAFQDYAGDPLIGLKYRLKIGPDVTEGELDGEGLLEQRIDPKAKSATLTIISEEQMYTEESDEPQTIERRYVWDLKIGSLDPVETARGVQSRLNNLAHDSGAVDGIVGPITKAATIEFQLKHELEPDGIAGPITEGKLKEIYGC